VLRHDAGFIVSGRRRHTRCYRDWSSDVCSSDLLLNEISDVTGGRMFRVDDVNELADVATKIGVELRNQYVLGYRPINAAHDGKWRKIKVKLNAPKGLPPLTVHAKTGYYAPTE